MKPQRTLTEYGLNETLALPNCDRKSRTQKPQQEQDTLFVTTSLNVNDARTMTYDDVRPNRQRREQSAIRQSCAY